MFRIAGAAVALALLATPAIAQSVALGDGAGATLGQGISGYELFNSTSSQVTSGEAVVLVHTLDPEAAPNDLAAILLVGQFGTGIEPIELRIVSTSPVRLAAGIQPGTFDLTIAGRTFPLSVAPNGAVVLNGVEMGRLH